MSRFCCVLVLLWGISTLSFRCFAQEAPYTFGPIILGQVLTPLPECQKQKTNPFEVVTSGPCQETITEGVRTIRNIPYDGAEVHLESTDECFQQNHQSLVEANAKCPVAHVFITIAEEQCGPVLKALKGKFGPSASYTETVQNGFGASWDITLYPLERKEWRLDQLCRSRRACRRMLANCGHAEISRGIRRESAQEGSILGWRG